MSNYHRYFMPKIYMCKKQDINFNSRNVKFIQHVKNEDTYGFILKIHFLLYYIYHIFFAMPEDVLFCKSKNILSRLFYVFILIYIF